MSELGWEVHCELPDMASIYEAVFASGIPHGITPFGAYAINSMRLEKGYRAWGSDLTTERTPLEAGVGAFVRADDRDFIGRDAMLAREAGGDRWSMELLRCEESGDADPFFGHAVLQRDQAVGMVTSGAYGHRLEARIVLAYLTPRYEPGVDLFVDILGEPVAANIGVSG